MIALTYQHLFVVLALLFSGFVRKSELRVGDMARVAIVDVDQNQLSTADGHATIVTRDDEHQADELGDRIPDEYLGNSKFGVITIVNCRGKILLPLRGVTTAVIRRRLDNEAHRLQRFTRQNT